MHLILYSLYLNEKYRFFVSVTHKEKDKVKEKEKPEKKGMDLFLLLFYSLACHCLTFSSLC